MRLDFDISILGCGGYGLPLGAFIKSLGKKAIHLGGGSQLLFGILGNRWTKDYSYSNLPLDFSTDYTPLFNEYWLHPLTSDTPNFANKIENGCYW